MLKSKNYSWKTCPWDVKGNKSYQILKVYRKPRPSAVARFLIDSKLLNTYKSRQGFVDEILERGACIPFGPCCGGRVKFDVDKGLYVHAECYPGVSKALPKAQEFGILTDKPIKVIDHSLLRYHRSDLYLTESTVLVSYEGQRYIFKGPENLSYAPFIYREFQALWHLDHPHIIPPPKILVKPFADSDRVLGFLLPYYPHENLREYVFKLRCKNKGPLSLLYKWAVQLSQVFHHLLYKKRILYLNIKPENCVVDKNENLITIDFEHGAYCRPEFRAPEMSGWHKTKTMSDTAQEKGTVFSVGRILWVIWKITPTNKYPEIGKDEEDSKTIFAGNTTAGQQRIQEMILQCVDPVPENRPSLIEISTFFEKEYGRFKQPKFIRKLTFFGNGN